MAKKTETRPATAAINPFGLRMQPELRERIEAAAAQAGRSLNAEIVARLEQGAQSGEEFQEMRNRLRTTEGLLDATSRMLSMTAYYLARCAERVPRDSDETKRLMESIQRLADGLQKGDFAAGIVPLQEIVELGQEVGVIDPATGRARDEFVDPLFPGTDQGRSKRRK